MIVFLTVVWLAVLGLLVTLKLLPNKPATWLSTVVFIILLTVFFFIPLQWSAPSGQAVVLVNTVPIVPNVAGQVTSVDVTPNEPVARGEVLFHIDPAPFQARLDGIDAQIQFAKLRVRQFEELADSPAGRRFDLEQAQATVRQLEAERDAAAFDLAQTTVVAPADGFVTTLALRAGQRVAAFPVTAVMTFIETDGKTVAAQIQQIFVRFVEPGQEVEIAFKARPGEIFTGRVEAVIAANVEGQILSEGTVVAPRNISAAPFFVRIALDDPQSLAALPGGTAGTIAIYTPRLEIAHVIRRVMLRMESYLNFINPRL
ncbi:MAG: efflux RND transporter periplasmic adaptor subunit [Pseudomonadota bacterium]